MVDEKKFINIPSVGRKIGLPEKLWDNFCEITKIPRCSKHEEKISEFIIQKAKDLGLEYKTDSIGNILVRKKAKDPSNIIEGIILQSHMDMVCEKNQGTEHDFSKDPLKLRIKGGYLFATNTTLGADNGIGLAAMLTVMEDSNIDHGQLEFLFTVDEETGLTGAFQLEKDFLDFQRMLNLDTEEEGAIYVGCAGGADTLLFYYLDFEPISQDMQKHIKVTGLLG